MHKKLDLYFYGETGAYDALSPSYVSHKAFVPEILYQIAQSMPYTLTQENLAEVLDLDATIVESAINSLLRINAISEKSHAYKLNFTVFLESDIEALQHFVTDAKQAMVNQIAALETVIDKALRPLTHRNRFTRERWLYHILCDSIFDGLAFDYFDKKGYFQSSKAQPGGRDYIIYGFENSPLVKQFSNNLLCSSNNFRSGSYVFNSFGDANGQRKDLFRFFKCINKSLASGSPFEAINLDYIQLNDENNKALAEACGKFLDKVLAETVKYEELSHEEKAYADWMLKFEYLEVSEGVLRCVVPVFEKADERVMSAIADLVLEQVHAIVRDFFVQFERDMTEVTSVRHDIEFKEVAIELWHQLFGFTNEELAAKGVVSTPSYVPGEGRYFRSFVRKFA